MRIPKKAAVLALALGGAAAAAAAQAQVPAVVTESLDNMAVSRPAEAAGALPVVFLAHNGGAKKEDWGDFPEELASKGYLVVNVGWTKSSGGADINDSMKKALASYPGLADPAKVALIGGCHGCVKFLYAMGPSMPVQPKALVLLSMSELMTAPSRHAPILGIYSTSDHLGGGYVATQKKVYESSLTEPKTVVALDSTPHGNELATDESTRAQVRLRIEEFLSQNLN
jgi:hypothetical protein